MRDSDATDVREIWLQLGEALMYLFAYTTDAVVYMLGIYEALTGNINYGASDIVAACIAGWLLNHSSRALRGRWAAPKKRTRK